MFGRILVFQNYFIENTVEIRHIQTKLSCATVRDCAGAVQPGKQNVFVTFNEKNFKALSSSPKYKYIKAYLNETLTLGSRYSFSVLEDSGWNFRHAYYHEMNRRTLLKVRLIR